MKKLFLTILNADCDRICVENPTPMKIWELPKATQVIQPWQFGHAYSKRTLLWLKNLPWLEPTHIITDGIQPYVNSQYTLKGKKVTRGVACNAKDRSKTFPGIARAMATQWGSIL